MDTAKVCTKCGLTKPLSDFYARHDRPGQHRSACKRCVRQPSTPETRKVKAASAARRRAADPAMAHRGVLRQHGVTPEWYAETLASQGGGCAICHRTEEENGRKLAVDHDHRHCSGQWGCSVCVRGLLCVSCNTGIGYLGDAPERLQAAADYLTQYQQ